MSVMQWSYSLVIRAKNAAGTTVATYYAGTLSAGMSGTVMAIPTRIGPPTYEKVELPRELWDYGMAPVTVGWRPRLVVAWEQRSVGILSQTIIGSSDLRQVLQTLTTAGGWLEVSLDGGTTWRKCYLGSDSIDYHSVGGKAVALALELEFVGMRLLTATLPDASATLWGTAT